LWEESRVGIWKESFSDGKDFRERMWGIKNMPIEDIKTYRFNDWTCSTTYFTEPYRVRVVEQVSQNTPYFADFYKEVVR
jgi:hypothetical protein